MKADRNTFLKPFSTFIVQKSTEKSWIHGPPQRVDQHLHVNQLGRVDQNGKNTVFCPFLDVFSLFQTWNHWKSFNMNKKGWKWLKKSISTSFLMCPAHKSWSKYTTSLAGERGWVIILCQAMAFTNTCKKMKWFCFSPVG